MEKVIKDKLWTPSFCAVAAGNFLLFFAFYLLLPVLPMYLSEAFSASRSMAGFILSSYTITALMVRPFAGYMVDTFPRKKLLLICYFVFLLFFGGYLLAGTLLLFAIIRAGHGVAFGLLTVSNSTVAIDVMPSSRRGEGIGYYGVSNNLAMAIGPTLSLYIHDSFANYDYIFLISMLSATIGLLCVSTIKMPYRRDPVPEKPPVSLDRFLLLKGMPEALTLIFFSFSYGVLSTYLAVYGKEELGIEALPEQLQEVGFHRGGFEDVFYGQVFRDNELSKVYLYREPVDISCLTLQESEVSEVIWMDYRECLEKIRDGSLDNCIYIEEFDMVGKALGV